MSEIEELKKEIEELKKTQQHVCPTCGRCLTCGNPFWQYIPQYPIPTYPIITWIS
jgi:DNA-directed RNA polymerase subunit RPC12/RpoP